MESCSHTAKRSRKSTAPELHSALRQKSPVISCSASQTWQDIHYKQQIIKKIIRSQRPVLLSLNLPKSLCHKARAGKSMQPLALPLFRRPAKVPSVGKSLLQFYRKNESKQVEANSCLATILVQDLLTQGSSRNLFTDSRQKVPKEIKAHQLNLWLKMKQHILLGTYRDFAGHGTAHKKMDEQQQK